MQGHSKRLDDLIDLDPLSDESKRRRPARDSLPLSHKLSRIKVEDTPTPFINKKKQSEKSMKSTLRQQNSNRMPVIPNTPHLMFNAQQQKKVKKKLLDVDKYLYDDEEGEGDEENNEFVSIWNYESPLRMNTENKKKSSMIFKPKVLASTDSMGQQQEDAASGCDMSYETLMKKNRKRANALVVRRSEIFNSTDSYIRRGRSSVGVKKSIEPEIREEVEQTDETREQESPLVVRNKKASNKINKGNEMETDEEELLDMTKQSAIKPQFNSTQVNPDESLALKRADPYPHVGLTPLQDKFNSYLTTMTSHVVAENDNTSFTKITKCVFDDLTRSKVAPFSQMRSIHNRDESGELDETTMEKRKLSDEEQDSSANVSNTFLNEERESRKKKKSLSPFDSSIRQQSNTEQGEKSELNEVELDLILFNGLNLNSNRISPPKHKCTLASKSSKNSRQEDEQVSKKLPRNQLRKAFRKCSAKIVSVDDENYKKHQEKQRKEKEKRKEQLRKKVFTLSYLHLMDKEKRELRQAIRTLQSLNPLIKVKVNDEFCFNSTHLIVNFERLFADMDRMELRTRCALISAVLNNSKITRIEWLQHSNAKKRWLDDKLFSLVAYVGEDNLSPVSVDDDDDDEHEDYLQEDFDIRLAHFIQKISNSTNPNHNKFNHLFSKFQNVYIINEEKPSSSCSFSNESNDETLNATRSNRKEDTNLANSWFLLSYNSNFDYLTEILTKCGAHLTSRPSYAELIIAIDRTSEYDLKSEQDAVKLKQDRLDLDEKLEEIKKEFKSNGWVHVVSSEWLLDSVLENRVLDFDEYVLAVIQSQFVKENETYQSFLEDSGK